MIHIRLAAFLLAATAVTPALAEDIAARSRIDAVTVFPSGAEVTRIAEARLLAGEHTLVFDDLPGELMPETVRLEGDAGATVEIGSVDVRQVPVPAAETDARRRAIDAQIEALEDERRLLDQSVADAEFQKTLMQQLASASFNAAATARESDRPALNASDVGQMIDMVGGKLAVLSKTVLEARVRQRQVDAAIEDLRNQRETLAPAEAQRVQVKVHLAAGAETDGVFRLRYRIAGAGWQPVYDARLTSPDGSGKARMELVRRASVTQSTTEEWSNVALTLSTARPVGATAVPDLEPFLIGAAAVDLSISAQPREMRRLSKQEYNQAYSEGKMSDDALLSAAPSPVRQLQAEVQLAGFQALYAVPGRVSVDNTGTAKAVRIGTERYDATLTARSVPKLDPNAYLTARFTLGGEAPLLPGTAMLYRDGVYMGQGYLPPISPGEETSLGFGADDLIKVKRVEVTRKRGAEGLITTSNTDVRAYDITVKNLHDFTIPVTVVDQVPYATLRDVTVELLPGMTPASASDFEKKRGVLAWNFDLAPQAQSSLKHGYKVSWPETVEIGMILN